MRNVRPYQDMRCNAGRIHSLADRHVAPICTDKLLDRQVGTRGLCGSWRGKVARMMEVLWWKVHAKAHNAGEHQDAAANEALGKELSAFEPIVGLGVSCRRP